jgi:cell division protein FtsA
MAKEIYYGAIDIGSSEIRAVIARKFLGEETLQIVGVGTTPSLGIRKGVVVDVDSLAKAINEALESAERMAGTPMQSVAVSVTGADIQSHDALGVVAVGRADGEVTEDDTARVFEEVQTRLILPMNREIIHVIPKDYRLDDTKNIKDPVGLRGVRLEMGATVVSLPASHLKNTRRALELASLQVENVTVEAIAAAEAVLDQKHKELGTALVNIGGATTSLAVYEDGNLLHLAVIPVGSAHITNDVAIALRSSIEVAEAVKLQYGTVNADEVGKREEIDLSLFDSQEEGLVSRHHVAEVIEARYEELCQLMNEELKSIGREALLPGGVILTGGGAALPGVVEKTKDILRLPVHLGYPRTLSGVLDQVDNPAFATVLGLVFFLDNAGHEGLSSGSSFFINKYIPENIGSVFGGATDWIKKFLP